MPEHTVASLDTVPPTETGDTVMVASLEIASEQTPLLTTALYFVVALRFVAVNVVVVFVILVTSDVKLSVEDSQRTILPV